RQVGEGGRGSRRAAGADQRSGEAAGRGPATDDGKRTIGPGRPIRPGAISILPSCGPVARIMPKPEKLPYRPCVGTAVFNRAGLVCVGRRIDGPEHTDATHAWQMPQGGVDPGEDPWPAALRELYEETNIRSVEKLGEVADWLSYDIPRAIIGQVWKGKY